MNDKEIILSRIAEIISRPYFFIKSNSEFKARLKCVGLNEYFDKYSEYLIPFWYSTGYSQKFEHSNDEYDVFLGLDSIFLQTYITTIDKKKPSTYSKKLQSLLILDTYLII